jgi:hypothetical protein
MAITFPITSKNILLFKIYYTGQKNVGKILQGAQFLTSTALYA